jgi:hypothetical protein
MFVLVNLKAYPCDPVGIARAARDVWWFDVLLAQLEATLGLERRIALEVLIEDAEGLSNAVEIARASDRLEALIFGAGDLSGSLRNQQNGDGEDAAAEDQDTGNNGGAKLAEEDYALYEALNLLKGLHILSRKR